MNNNEQSESAQDKYEFRPFTNDFVFALVMRDPDICKGIAELILPDEEIGEVKIALSDDSSPDRINDPEVVPQASLDFGKDMRGVRFENGLVPICASILMERPSANGSPDCQRQAGYEPTAKYAVECHVLKHCTPDRGLTGSSYFAGSSLSGH